MESVFFKTNRNWSFRRRARRPLFVQDTRKLSQDKQRLIFCEKEGRCFRWHIEDFEKEMEVKYLFGLEFATPKILQKVVQKCEQFKEEELISKREIWLGTVFEKEILEGFVGEVVLRWISPEFGYGLFAAFDLPKGAYIGEYLGVVRPFSERKDQKNCYCFEYKTHLNGKAPFTIDARDKGNLIRYINHSSANNLTPELAFCNGVMHVILLTNRPITKGEELTYDYGSSYWAKREEPLIRNEKN
jgi:hypothetical protein